MPLIDVIDEEKLVEAAARLLVPALQDALTRAIHEVIAGLDGLTVAITVSRKPEAP